ncbi:MAG: ATP-binding cassette domain-containing protein [Gemmatimonadota bacterium]|nr:MAG: ATP-binding cassette domain-containing protein [Gemmatimonadota bacterium]
MSAASVRIEGLTKVFYDDSRGEVRAVDDVHVECASGEILGLLGANGAGKTTTLRMLSTVLTPTGGCAWVMGHELREAPQDVRLSIGFYSASTALYPKITPRETLRFFARVNRYPPDRVEERVELLIDRFGLSEYADSRVEKLSSGMKQKVSIARTLAHDPPVLIFDEPTVALDVLNALELREIIGQLRDDGKAIIFSTHVMSEAEQLCDRIAIIHNGRILACDTLDGLRGVTGKHYLEEIFVHFARDSEA